MVREIAPRCGGGIEVVITRAIEPSGKTPESTLRELAAVTDKVGDRAGRAAIGVTHDVRDICAVASAGRVWSGIRDGADGMRCLVEKRVRL
jgi:hypothetical protein